MTTAGTVGGVMLRRPTVHPADTTVRAARAAFAASPKLHLLLLVRDGRLIGTLDRRLVLVVALFLVSAATADGSTP